MWSSEGHLFPPGLSFVISEGRERMCRSLRPLPGLTFCVSVESVFCFQPVPWKQRPFDREDSGNRRSRHDSCSDLLCELGTITKPLWTSVFSFGKLGQYLPPPGFVRLLWAKSTMMTMTVVMVMMKMVMMICLHSQSLGILPEVTQQGCSVVWDWPWTP